MISVSGLNWRFGRGDFMGEDIRAPRDVGGDREIDDAIFNGGGNG